MSARSETTHQVGASTVVVRELTSPIREFHVYVDGEKYEVFLGNSSDPGTDPDRWYTEVGGEIEGPYDTAQELMDELFLREEI